MISVLIITYNGESFLKEQLDSIYAQTVLPDEIVVSDDCSQDGTIDILREYHQKYGLKYHINPHNLGYLGNVKRSLELCQGDYIIFADQDDIWFPNRIETALSKMKQIEKENRPAIVTCCFINVDAEGKVLRHNNMYKDSQAYDLHLFGYFTMASASMINRPLLELYKSLPVPKDFMLGIIASMTGSIYRMGEQLFYYRRHEDNTMNKMNSRLHKRVTFEWLFRDKYSTFYSKNTSSMNEINDTLSQYFIPERVPLFNKIKICLEQRSFNKQIKTLLTIKEINLINKLLICCILMRHRNIES
jgi:glycosyltransferase involved in cell wall biosynthesis